MQALGKGVYGEMWQSIVESEGGGPSSGLEHRRPVIGAQPAVPLSVQEDPDDVVTAQAGGIVVAAKRRAHELERSALGPEPQKIFPVSEDRADVLVGQSLVPGKADRVPGFDHHQTIRCTNPEISLFIFTETSHLHRWAERLTGEYQGPHTVMVSDDASISRRTRENVSIAQFDHLGSGGAFEERPHIDEFVVLHRTLQDAPGRNR